MYLTYPLRFPHFLRKLNIFYQFASEMSLSYLDLTLPTTNIQNVPAAPKRILSTETKLIRCKEVFPFQDNQQQRQVLRQTGGPLAVG